VGGAEPCPTKFDSGATLQQSSNIFYQKFLKIVSVGGCGEEKGFKGKGNRRSCLRICSAAFGGLASRKIFRAACELERGKEEKYVVAPPTRAPIKSPA
jgi:hypothetical protein